MGNNNKTKKKNSSNDIMFNLDVNIKGDLNIYVCGNINTYLNCKDGFYSTAPRNYHVLEQIFEKSFKAKEENIQLKSNDKIIFQYEYRKKERNKKQYNAFLLLNKVDEEFLDILFEHLFNFDKKNENKNVVIFFGEEDDIKKSFDKLYKKSKETVPFLIIVDKSKYSDKLNYINHIPDLLTIENILKEEKKEFSEDELLKLSEKAFVYYMNMKLFRIHMYYNQLGFNLNLINPMNEIYLKIKANVTIGLFGYSGCGKSTLINLIFNELVARASASSKDVTKKCSEYYIPIKEISKEEIGQIRFLDFPGISEDKNYQEIVKPEVEKKLEEYKKNMEQIDVALFFISNGNNREFTNNGLNLVKLLHEKKIKIIFVINGPTDDFNMEIKQEKLRNSIDNTDILYKDYSNLIFTNFYQYLKGTSKNGISKIFQKIIEEIKIKDKKFNVEDININNYNEKLLLLSKCNRIFEEYGRIDAIKEKAKIKANLIVTGYSLLSLGSSALSLVVPIVDCALAIGYQIAMVFNILSIYELRSQDYDIVNIILSGGETIELKQKFKPKKAGNTKDDKTNKDNMEVKKGAIREVIKDASGAVIYVGECGIKGAATKEAGKMIIQKTVETMMTDAIEAAAIKTTANTVEVVMVNSVEMTVEKTLEKIVIESTKELAETGLKEGTKVMVNVAKNAVISVAEEGGEQLVMVGTKESVKTITETVIIQQGGKTWLINLGKAVPFIGAAISAVMNTYSTAKLGKRLVDKFNDEFDKNQQRQVDLLKGRVNALLHIIEQMKSIINDEKNETKF